MYYWKKPKNIKYTDMCKWIDENSRNTDCDQIQLFNYLYGIILILAYKWKYFSNERDYDDFAVSTASIEFRRITDPDKKPIKYILPYLKTVLYGRKVSWMRQYYKEDIATTTDTVSGEYGTRLRDIISGGISKCNFELYLNDIPGAIYCSIKGIPHKINSDEFDNIYLSVLLTFINQIHLTDKQSEKLEASSTEVVYNSAYDRIRKMECSKPPILYHLDESYADYITNKIKE